jgi:hypothetical protein
VEVGVLVGIGVFVGVEPAGAPTTPQLTRNTIDKPNMRSWIFFNIYRFSVSLSGITPEFDISLNHNSLPI